MARGPDVCIAGTCSTMMRMVGDSARMPRIQSEAAYDGSAAWGLQTAFFTTACLIQKETTQTLVLVTPAMKSFASGGCCSSLCQSLLLACAVTSHYELATTVVSCVDAVGANTKQWGDCVQVWDLVLQFFQRFAGKRLWTKHSQQVSRHVSKLEKPATAASAEAPSKLLLCSE